VVVEVVQIVVVLLVVLVVVVRVLFLAALVQVDKEIVEEMVLQQVNKELVVVEGVRE
jgi:hypothetical protein